MTTTRFRFLVFLIAALAAIPTHLYAQQALGEPAANTAEPRKHSSAFLTSPSPQTNLIFDRLEVDRIQRLQQNNANRELVKALQIGIHRNVSDEANAMPILNWVKVNGGFAARFQVTSPTALGLRIQLDAKHLPAKSEFRFQENPVYVGKYDAKAIQSMSNEAGFWSPVITGDTAIVEWFYPAQEKSLLPLYPPVISISHLLVNFDQTFSLASVMPKNFTCMEDVACGRTRLGQQFADAENSVARMIFTRTDGTYTCTGALLNDTVTTSQIPYFLTNYHCIRNQSEANTLVTYWENEAPSCGAAGGGGNVVRTGGAEFLYGAANLDAILLRLNSTPPTGAFFAGWNASPPSNGPVVSVHHPSGNTKRYGEGSHYANGNNLLLDSQQIISFAALTWSRGATAPGSSGSPWFTVDAGTGQYLVRGGLMGGESTCATTGQSPNSGNLDYYSRMDAMWPSIQQYLSPSNNPPLPPLPAPTREYGGAWYNPAESGWGLMMSQYPGPDANTPGQLFSLFFVYDASGNPTWYQFQGQWTGVDEVTATISRSAGATWGNAYNGTSRQLQSVGTGTLIFTSATSATLTINIPGVANRTVNIVKL